ncbi:MAG: hypothetical protein JWM38_168 [Sphingomonas bacterium]|jgi:uncharacterized SAM-binding protein YcdF (DUF218 family)|nr:hypothetical protein [Sphingomonas bacterium]MDB5683941.1 hypothetical protein [Sphingomonas bacterium]MDB5716741.1 hypothetical protein [Sphingomonas bacterium]
MIVRLASALLLAWMLGFAWFATGLPGPADDTITDAIVVPTGGTGRVKRGMDLLQRHRARRMLISGVDRRVRPPEIAESFGVPLALVDCCIDLGREAVDTRSNGAETAAWLRQRGYRSVRLVTTDWHMARARYELSRNLGTDIILIGDAVPSEPGLMSLLTEYNKYVLRRFTAPFGL